MSNLIAPGEMSLENQARASEEDIDRAYQKVCQRLIEDFAANDKGIVENSAPIAGLAKFVNYNASEFGKPALVASAEYVVPGDKLVRVIMRQLINPEHLLEVSQLKRQDRANAIRELQLMGMGNAAYQRHNGTLPMADDFRVVYPMLSVVEVDRNRARRIVLGSVDPNATRGRELVIGQRVSEESVRLFASVNPSLVVSPKILPIELLNDLGRVATVGDLSPLQKILKPGAQFVSQQSSVTFMKPNTFRQRV